MTVEEKAKSLLISMVKITGNEVAKFCAIVVCDEVIENNSNLFHDGVINGVDKNTNDIFWNSVKKHIEDNY